jgi:streptogramin lyase
VSFALKFLSFSCVVVCAGGLAPGGIAPAAAEHGTASTGQLVPVAGNGEVGYSGDGQRATDARIDSSSIAAAPDGTLYLADSHSGRIRAVDSSGVIDTVDGWRHGPSDRPDAIVAGRDGSLYVAGDDTIRRLGRGGTSTTIAETEAAGIYLPEDIGVDGAGNVYVSSAGRIVKIDRARRVTAIAGGGRLDLSRAEGKPATTVRLPDAYLEFAVDGRGAVYFGGSSEERAAFYRIDPNGTLHTVAGGGKPGFAGDGGPAAEARLSGRLPGVEVTAAGEIYVLDAGNGVVRVIGTDGVITSIAPPIPPTDDSSALSFGDLTTGPHGEIYVKAGARVYQLVRNGRTPATGPAHPADYPAPYPRDEPGTVHTVAGSGRPVERTERPVDTRQTDYTFRIAVGPDGTSYYSDASHHRVMKVAPDGTGSVLAGTGKPGFVGDRGAAARAMLNTPTGVDVGRDGSVYIADSGNDRVRKVDPRGVITTVAGNGTTTADERGSSGKATLPGDGGPATQAAVTPVDVAVAPNGSLYLAEDGNSRIGRVAPNGTISTFAGNGKLWAQEADGHPAADANFFEPYAVAVGRDGAVYVLDDDVDTVRPAVRMIDPKGIVRTVAGGSDRDAGEAGFGGDGGPAARAELNNPRDIAPGPDGTLYIADTYNARVRAVSTAGTIGTIAGTGRPADSGDDAAATKAAVNEPQTVGVDTHGAVQVISRPGDRIREIDGGTIATTATLPSPGRGDTTSGGEAAAATALDLDPSGLAVDHDGNLLIANDNGEAVSVDPHGTVGRPFAGAPSLVAEVIATGPDGARYVSAGGVVYRVPAHGSPVPLAGGGPTATTPYTDRVERGRPATLAFFGRVVDLAVSVKGELFIATRRGVYRLTGDGTLATAFAVHGSHGTDVSGIAVDADGRLYVAVMEENKVYRVDVDGTRTTVAGNGGTGSIEDDPTDVATDAAVFGPADVAVDGDGNLYIGAFHGIYRVDADGTIMTVTRNTGRDDSGYAITPLAVNRHGDLYYVDQNFHQVKVMVQPGQLGGPFPWGTVIWTAVGVLVVGGAGTWFALRRWRRRSTPQEPDTEPEESTEDTKDTKDTGEDPA